MRSALGILGIVTCVLFASVVATGSARPHATPTPSPSPTPFADPAITQLARQQFVDWQAGVVNQRLYVKQVINKLSAAKISDTSHALGELGALTDTIYIGAWTAPDFPVGARGYIYQMRCTNGNEYLWLALDPQGKIATIYFKNRLDVETVTPAPSPT